MQIAETKSVRGAETLLCEREALEACREVARHFDDQLKEDEKRLRSLGFAPEYSFGAGGNRPRFDAYSEKWKVGIEREMREQMNVRSHLLFSEIGYQKEVIDIAVFILPMEGLGTFGRTVREVTEYEVFTKYFPLEVPLYLIGCEEEIV